MSTIHCCTVLAYIESWRALLQRVAFSVWHRVSYRLLVFGDEHNTLLHRVGIFGEWLALLQLLVYGGEHSTIHCCTVLAYTAAPC